MRYLGSAVGCCGCGGLCLRRQADPPSPGPNRAGRARGGGRRRWAVEMPDFTRDLFDALAEHAAFTGDILATWGTSSQQKKNPPRSKRAHFHTGPFQWPPSPRPSTARGNA